MNAKEASIVKQAARIQWRERAKATAQKTAEQRKLIGKCYRYSNSYGSDSERWWLYAKVTGVDADGGLRTLQFQTDCRGDMRIDPNGYAISLLDGYEEIAAGDFDRAFTSLKETVLSLA